MSIKVDEVIGVGGFILPNTYVDVIGVQQIGNSSEKKVETQSVQNNTVSLLAVPESS